MRKVFILLIALMFITIGSAYAGEKSCDSKWWGKIANECHKVDSHDHDDPQAGIGADVVLWKNETDKAKFIEEVTAEYRADLNNSDHSIYGVVRVNLWDKIKSLFNKGE